MIKLECGDCYELIKNIPDKSIDLILTDHPYLFEIDNRKSTKHTNKLDSNIKKLRNDIKFMANGFDYEYIFKEFMRVCKIPNFIIFCSNKQISKTMSYFENLGLSATVLIWNKYNAIPACNNIYISDIEFIIYVRDKGACFNNDVPINYKHKVKTYPSISGGNVKKYHPAQKPEKLLNELISLHSKENDTVLDCFMGSGSTGVVCKALNRNFIGFEIDSYYFNVAKQRIETGYFIKEIEDDMLSLF